MGGEGLRAAIQKGPVHKAIDDLVNTPGMPRQALLNDLRALQPRDDDQTPEYLAVLQRHLPALDQRFLNYLHDTWYSPSDAPPPRPLRFGAAGFWPVQYHPTEPIVRKGLIKAIELAIETNRPLDSYWIPASDRFETIVILNDQQVTRLILTPPTPPPQRPERIANSAAIWMIKRGVVEPFEDAEDTSGPVLITRLKIPPAPAVWPNA